MNFYDDVEPRYEQIAPKLFLQRFDDILGSEAELHEAEEKQSAEQLYQASQLRARVAKAEGISEEEAEERMKTDRELVSKYASELSFLMASGPSQRAAQVRMVTHFIRTRGHTLAADGSKVKIEGWDEEKTRQQPTKLLDAVSAFIDKERYGWDPKTAAKGKPRPAA